MTDALAVIAGKLSAKAIRALGVGLGSNVPGRVSRAISPTVLTDLACQARSGVLAVSGTNGKSTTAGLIASIIGQAGKKIAHNRQGANLVPGVTASLIEAAQWSGKLDVDYCLFEIDEAALPLVAAETKIGTVVVTNLFRDQLDRFGELDTTAALISKGIAVANSHVILNADDPNVAKLAPNSKRLYFGIESLKEALPPSSAAAELSYCARCQSEYSYQKYFYGQLGHYRCKQCGSTRPLPDVVACDVTLQPGGSSFIIICGDVQITVKLGLPGLFNVYNALAAAALGFSLGFAPAVIAAGLQNYSTLFGRSERLKIAGKQLLIQLIKNPAGASQAVQAVAGDGQARILIAINDNYADGRDVSWLWDADFEVLSKHPHPIFVSGTRSGDMAVRLKYAGVPAANITVVSALEDALSQSLNATGNDQTLWLLPTYTCLLALQKIIKARGQILSGTN